MHTTVALVIHRIHTYRIQYTVYNNVPINVLVRRGGNVQMCNYAIFDMILAGKSLFVHTSLVFTHDSESLLLSLYELQ